MRAENQFISKVKVSMVSLKWGDVLSLLLPGVVALFAISPYFPALHERVEKLDQITPTFGVILLIGAILAGALLGAFTRIVWERYWLLRWCRVPANVMRNVTQDKDLYERLVENSYKYVLFYANFAWALCMLLFIGKLQGVPFCSARTLILTLAIGILIRASHMQWTYYVGSMNNFYGEDKDNVKERTPTGNAD